MNIGAGVDHTVNEYYEAAAEVDRLRRQLHPRPVEAGRHEAQADGRQPRQRMGLDRQDVAHATGWPQAYAYYLAEVAETVGD